MPNAHIYQRLVILSVQVSEQVPAGHLHHRQWELLRGHINQPFQQAPRFPAERTQNSPNNNERLLHDYILHRQVPTAFQKAATVLLGTLKNLISGNLTNCSLTISSFVCVNSKQLFLQNLKWKCTFKLKEEPRKQHKHWPRSHLCNILEKGLQKEGDRRRSHL